MKKSELINYLKENIRINAYCAAVCEKLSDIGFDVGMMDYNKNIHYGKAFAFIETLSTITDKHDESVYEEAVNEAIDDMKCVNYDIVKLLNMAGYDGEEYYKLNK